MIHAGVDLARRLEFAEAENDAECTPAQAGTAVERIGGGWAIFAGAGSPLTRAIGVGLSGAVSEAELRRLEEFFEDRGARITIDLCPLADAGLLDWIGRRGYRPIEFNQTMVRELAGMESYPLDARVRTAAPHEARVWAETVGSGFFETDTLGPEEVEVGLAVFRMGRAECYLAEGGSGEPAAGGALSVWNGLGLMFADGTILKYRRQGLHGALIRARLNRALARACDLSAASTAPGSASQRNYERAGFRIAYTKVVLEL